MNSQDVNDLETARQFCKNAVSKQKSNTLNALKRAHDFERLDKSNVRAFGSQWRTPGVVWIDRARGISCTPYEEVVGFSETEPSLDGASTVRLYVGLRSVVERVRHIVLEDRKRWQTAGGVSGVNVLTSFPVIDETWPVS